MPANSNCADAPGRRYLPDVPGVVGSLKQGVAEAFERGGWLAHVVAVLAAGADAATRAGGALGLAGAAWRAHVETEGADSVLAGDALLTRALELGCEMPDEGCRRAFLEYLVRAFSAGGQGGRFLVGAAVEIGLTIGGWDMRDTKDGVTGELLEMMRSAGGPVLPPREGRSPDPGTCSKWASLLSSPVVAGWRKQ